MHAIQWKKQAINDLIEIGRHIAKSSIENAEAMVDMIESKVIKLSAYAELGRVGRKRGTREMVAHAHYLVIYRVTNKQRVEILRVKHSA